MVILHKQPDVHLQFEFEFWIEKMHGNEEI